MGCNPFTHVCQACQDDTWCSPGGTCQANGQCANVNCGGQDGGTVDSGIDAGSSTTADAAQPPADAGFNPDATSNPDATLVDTGPRAGTTPYVRDDVYDEGCRCVAPTAGTHGSWALAGLLFAGSVALRRQTRRRA